MSRAALSIVGTPLPEEDQHSGNLVRAVMTARLTAHDEVLATIAEKELAKVLQLRLLDPASALRDAERAHERLMRLNSRERLLECQQILLSALGSPFVEHMVRSLLEVMLDGLRGRVANRPVFVDALLYSIDREELSPPIVAGAVPRLWLRRKMIPSHQEVIEVCRAHREEVRRAAAVVKQALAIRANAEEVLAAAAKIKYRQVSFDFMSL